jgi:hypothetical protein
MFIFRTKLLSTAYPKKYNISQHTLIKSLKLIEFHRIYETYKNII